MSIDVVTQVIVLSRHELDANRAYVPCTTFTSEDHGAVAHSYEVAEDRCPRPGWDHHYHGKLAIKKKVNSPYTRPRYAG